MPTFLHGHNARGPRKPKVELPQTPCECGCGALANPGKRYIAFHFARPRTSERHLTRPCACGCGETTGKGMRYIRGHRARRPLAERFWEKVERTDACWLWQGHRNHKGYGYISVNRRHVGAHRVAYEMARGVPVPAGLEIDHLCHVRHCVNPDHLEAVTHMENLRRVRR